MRPNNKYNHGHYGPARSALRVALSILLALCLLAGLPGPASAAWIHDITSFQDERNAGRTRVDPFEDQLQIAIPPSDQLTNNRVTWSVKNQDAIGAWAAFNSSGSPVTATGNYLTIDGYVGAHSGGAYLSSGTATYNTVELLGYGSRGNDGAHSYNALYGAYISQGGTAMYNQVILNPGSVVETNTVYGAIIEGGKAEVAYNKVTAEDASSFAAIGGKVGVNATGDAHHNEVHVTGGAIGDIRGGEIAAGGGNAYNNLVRVNGGNHGTITGASIIPSDGKTAYGDVFNNRTEITGINKVVEGQDEPRRPNVNGAMNTSLGKVYNNVVIVDDSRIREFRGITSYGDAYNNTARLTNSLVNHAVAAVADGGTGYVHDNSLEIRDVTTETFWNITDQAEGGPWDPAWGDQYTGMVVYGTLAAGYIESTAGEDGHVVARNRVDIYDSTVRRAVGGWTEYGMGELRENLVYVHGSDNTIEEFVAGGYTSWFASETDPNEMHNEDAHLIGNIAIIEGGSFGGQRTDVNYTPGATEVDIIEGVNYLAKAYGGWASGGNVEGNKLYVYNVEQIGTLTGGETKREGNTISNLVSAINTKIEGLDLDDGTRQSGDIIGGITTGTGNVKNNIVLTSNVQVEDDAIGGKGTSGEISGNVLFLEQGSEVGGSVYGGISTSGAVTGNIVSLSASTVLANAATPNTVYGGYSDTGTVSGNLVQLLKNSVVETVIYGGYVTDSGNAEYNSVLLDGSSSVSEEIYGGYSLNGDATGNAAILRGGSSVGSDTDHKDVVGGYSENGSATGNMVGLYGGALVYGSVLGGKSDSADASYNMVILDGIELTLDALIGGLSAGTAGDASGNSLILSNATVHNDVTGGSANGGNANDNLISVKGGSVEGDVVAGLSSSGDATGNTVIVDRTTITGAVTGGSGSGDSYTGNTFNGILQASIGSLSNFQNLNFEVPASLKSGGTVVTVNGDVDWGGADTAVKSLSFTGGGGNLLKVGDYINLVYYGDNNYATNLGTTGDMRAPRGYSAWYDLEIAEVDDAVIARITGVQLNLRTTMSFTRNRTAAASLANLGGELAANQGVADLRSAMCDNARVFTASRGSVASYDGFDMKDASMLVGTAFGDCNCYGGFGLGVFMEAGYGSYEFDGGGDGDSTYMGGGLLMTAHSNNGLHADASLRFGRVEVDFTGPAHELTGEKAGYDRSAQYVGGHIGAGYEFPITPDKYVDVYGRYMFAKIDSEDLLIDNDPYHFDSIQSHKLRGGVRYTRVDVVQPYFGLAYEYELDGEATGEALGMALPSASLKGGSMVGEVGFTIKPKHDGRLSTSMAVEALLGKRDSLAGTLSFKYTF